MSRTTALSSIVKSNMSEYNAWRDMKKRCYNEASRYYKNTGAVGITVIKDWRDSFANFLKDMGKRPSPHHYLGRKNANANYTRKNTVWILRPQKAAAKAAVQIAKEIKATRVQVSAKDLKAGANTTASTAQLPVNDTPPKEHRLDNILQHSKVMKALRSGSDEMPSRRTPSAENWFWLLKLNQVNAVDLDGCIDHYMNNRIAMGCVEPAMRDHAVNLMVKRLGLFAMSEEDLGIGIKVLQAGDRYKFTLDQLNQRDRMPDAVATGAAINLNTGTAGEAADRDYSNTWALSDQHSPAISLKPIGAQVEQGLNGIQIRIGNADKKTIHAVTFYNDGHVSYTDHEGRRLSIRNKK